MSTRFYKVKAFTGPVLCDVACEQCDNTKHRTFAKAVQVNLLVKTINIMQTPGILCTQCNHMKAGKDLEPSLAEGIIRRIFKKQRMYRKPLLVAAALGLFVPLVGTSIAMEQNQAAYLAAPVTDDRYLVDIMSMFSSDDVAYRYGILRVKAINQDNVEFQISNYIYERASNARKDLKRKRSKQDTFYDAESFTLSFDELKSFRANDSILTIKR